MSPSPNKEKRRRIGGAQISLPFAKLTGLASLSDEDNDPGDEMDDNAAANSSFVDDSPIKAPAGNKSFKLLFDEALPLSKKGGTAKRKGSLSRSKATAGLFGDRIDRPVTIAKEEMGQDMGPGSIPGTMKDLRHKKGGAPVPSRSSSSGVDDFFSGDVASPNVLPAQELSRRPPSSEPPSRASTKRSLSDAEGEYEDAHGNLQVTPAAPILIPPSPPPNDASSRATSSFKGKGKRANNANSRKKAKVLEDMDVDEEDSSEERLPVKLVPRHRSKRRPEENDADFDTDSILGYATHRAPRKSSHQGQQEDLTATLLQDQSGKFEVDLPEKLKRVLNISPSKTRDSIEERVVRGLLSGRRETQYDPAKGGEIWDVGEEDEDRGEEAGESKEDGDWEGEPVPWEVGEL